MNERVDPSLAAGYRVALAGLESERWGFCNRLMAAEAFEAEAQAPCLPTEEFGRAYSACVAKTRPAFEGNL
jgi:hypothetical protein